MRAGAGLRRAAAEADVLDRGAGEDEAVRARHEVAVGPPDDVADRRRHAAERDHLAADRARRGADWRARSCAAIWPERAPAARTTASQANAASRLRTAVTRPARDVKPVTGVRWRIVAPSAMRGALEAEREELVADAAFAGREDAADDALAEARLELAARGGVEPLDRQAELALPGVAAPQRVGLLRRRTRL